MKIISWNVRGLGGFEKRKKVRKLVGEKKPLLMCLQKTKLMQIDDYVCASLWGNSSHGYFYRPSVGASDGLLILWDTEEVEILSSYSFDFMLTVRGKFVKSNEDFVLFNVYAPCGIVAQQVLWRVLTDRLASVDGLNICVCGDFNAMRGEEERRSSTILSRVVGINAFNTFIDNTSLVDLPFVGRRFTWYRGDGHSMSRIDRFLLSEDWCLRWWTMIGKSLGLIGGPSVWTRRLVVWG